MGRTATTLVFALGALAVVAAAAAAASQQDDSRLRAGGAAETDLSKSTQGEILILNEEFDGEFNLDLWKHEISMGGGGNWEFQVYGNNRTNSYLEDGKLIIQPTLTEDFLGADQVCGKQPITYDIWGLVPADQCTSNMFYGCLRGSNFGQRIAINPVMSSRLRTAGTFSFRYGRFEVKAKLPTGDWLWPAIWLLPENNAYGSWPASGEIDVMESRGNDPSYGEGIDGMGGVNQMSSAIHWGPHFMMDSWDQTYNVKKLEEGTYGDDFHTFGLYWDEKEMYTYVDSPDNKVLSVDFGDGTDVEGFWQKGDFENRFPGMMNPWKGRGVSAPYDQRFYIVMNVAVGGVSGFFPDDVGGKAWHNKDSDAAMKFFEATPEWYNTWNKKDSAMQVESVKVWQTKPDYFLDAHAASSISTNSGGSGIATPAGGAIVSSTGVGEAPSKSTSSHAPSSALWYVLCASIGGVVGAASIGWVMLRQNNKPVAFRNALGVASSSYETIQNSGNTGAH